MTSVNATAVRSFQLRKINWRLSFGNRAVGDAFEVGALALRTVAPKRKAGVWIRRAWSTALSPKPRLKNAAIVCVDQNCVL
jgi:hypothetical protein